MPVGDLRVLGPVEVVVDGSSVALRGKQRLLLAALVVGSGRPVPVDELVDALWGERPPASGRKLVQVYVSQLRAVLPEPVAIVTHPGGYRLEVPAERLDAARFERLLGEAAAAGREGNAALCLSLADQALALWRGRAFGELGYEEAVRPEAERLDELRLSALEESTAAQLALGRHDDALARVRVLADEHPLRERLQELAMLALYRCGRHAEALEHYAALRARLRDELGLEPGPALRGLQRRILEHDPALDARTDRGAAASALPVPPTPLVGRGAELAALRRLLERRESRLVVLTGAGGSGKTRLALEAARESAGSFANGAVLVELAPLRDPALVPTTLAEAVEAPEPADETVEDALVRSLAPRELLLVVDNAEHVREAAPLLSRLVARAPRLTVLVTSRAVLHVSGERVFPVAPLEEDDAVELLTARARALDPAFERTEENEGDLREICRRLDGLPLAIELAAARIRTLTPRVLHRRLSERFDLLTGGPRDLPARQQTLRAAVDWSVGLLSDRERGVLAGISVFAGGAPLAAAEAVCDADLDTLAALVDDHLVRRADAGGEPRFGLLETIREHAAELRAVDAELDLETRRRHAEWYLALAERAEPELGGDRQAHWFAVLETEHDNLRAALDELDGRGEHEALLRLAVSLYRFWYVRGHLLDARRALERALAVAGGQPPKLRRRALTAAAGVALLQGDYAAATSFAEEGLAAARETGEDALVANALSNLGAIVLAAGDAGRAQAALEEAVELARGVGDDRILALALNNLGDVALTDGRYADAEPRFEESLRLLRARGDTANIARSLFNAGAVDLMLGRLDRAAARLAESLELGHEAGDREDIAWCLEGLAGLAAAREDGERAALLLGAARAQLDGMGAAFKPFERRLHEGSLARATALCGEGPFAALVEDGAALPAAEALDLARAVAAAAPRAGDARAR